MHIVSYSKQTPRIANIPGLMEIWVKAEQILGLFEEKREERRVLIKMLWLCLLSCSDCCCKYWPRRDNYFAGELLCLVIPSKQASSFQVSQNTAGCSYSRSCRIDEVYQNIVHHIFRFCKSFVLDLSMISDATSFSSDNMT